ncbi:MAG: GGDEF domain-containing protein [Spirochaetales bacterium]|nr:GGDEF domain-containing protein [Spirochaetales bacterium]
MHENIRRAIINTSGFLSTIFVVYFVFAFLLVNHYIRQLETLVVRDPLTNLFTKRFLNEILPPILSKYRREKDHLLAAIFIDIDHFKAVNDQYGHKYGDVVLSQIAHMMASKVRPNDFCIRFGGEEFVIVGQFENKQSIIDCAERIRQSIALIPFSFKNVQFNVTISAGIAIYDGSEQFFEDTLKRADEMLYHSKTTGRNRVSI